VGSIREVGKERMGGRIAKVAGSGRNRGKLDHIDDILQSKRETRGS